MTDKDWTYKEWTEAKPENFELSPEQYGEVMALSEALYSKLVELDIPAVFNFVKSQRDDGTSATEGFTVRGSIGRTTIEIMMGGILNTESATGMYDKIEGFYTMQMAKYNNLVGGGNIIQLPTDRI